MVKKIALKSALTILNKVDTDLLEPPPKFQFNIENQLKVDHLARLYISVFNEYA